MHSKELKKQCLQLHLQGMHIETISKTCLVARSTIYRWIKENQPVNEEMPNCTLADVHRMQQHITKLENIMRIIRDTGYIASIPLQSRLERCVEINQKERYSIHEICEAKCHFVTIFVLPPSLLSHISGLRVQQHKYVPQRLYL